jgi:hypothetical protein
MSVVEARTMAPREESVSHALHTLDHQNLRLSGRLANAVAHVQYGLIDTPADGFYGDGRIHPDTSVSVTAVL